MVDLTLSLILFTDAANANLRTLRRNWFLPARMLAVGLPGAMVLGAVFAAIIFGQLSFYEAAVVGVMLAATDAALGKAVVTNPEVPSPLRESLNVESGLNDGLCVPFLMLFLALASGHHGESALELVVEELGIGVLVGVLVAGTGALLLDGAHSRGWISKVWLQLCLPALAFTCFGVAQTLHGSGYIAAFVGGLVFGSVLRSNLHELAVPAEGIGEAMAMFAWISFGVLVVTRSLDYMTWDVVIYALLSLTVIRMVPVALSLVGRS